MIPKDLMRKLNEGRQYRDIDVSRFERRSGESGEKTVEGYATVFDQPYELYRWAYDGTIYIVSEQVDSKAFEGCDMSDVIMQYNHEGRVFARTSNGTLEVAPDGTGLHIRAQLGGTALGGQVYEEIDGGYTTKMSFGFTVGADKRDRTEERDEETGVTTISVLRTITRISKLYDVSAVSLPANDATSISARSFVDGVIEELKQERLAAEKRERQKKAIRVLCAL
jgi:HK97 family phage prohead protease